MLPATHFLGRLQFFLASSHQKKSEEGFKISVKHCCGFNGGFLLELLQEDSSAEPEPTLTF